MLRARVGRVRARRALTLAVAAAATSGLGTPSAGAALAAVAPRTALSLDAVGQPQLAALPDGRALVGWVSNSSTGDHIVALTRPAGGVLPSAVQGLRGGTPGEDLTFLPGGPAGNPVLTYFQDMASRSPYRVKLDGDLFTTQTGILDGVYSNGRFPMFARCPDGTTLFSYQISDIAPPNPTTFYSEAFGADASGNRVGITLAGAPKPDPYQAPRVTCDHGVRLFSSAVAGDDQQGSGLPEHLTVQQFTAGGGLLKVLDTDTVAAHAAVGGVDARAAADGRVWALWTESVSGTPSKSYLATRAPGSTGLAGYSATPFVASTPTESVFPSQLFFDAAGNTHVLIEHLTGSGQAYGIRTAPAGSAAFGAEQPLIAAGNRSVSQLILDHPDGNPRLLLSSPGPGNIPSYSLVGIPQAGSGNATTPIGLNGVTSVKAAFLPSGDLLVVGVRRTTGKPDELVEGGLDTGAPPTIDAVDVPGLAAAGVTTAVSASARDALGVGSFSWVVTGGSLPSPLTVSGQQASLPGLQPGSYEVRARAVDRAGNATEVSRTLRVLDPNAVTPGSQAFADAVGNAGGTLDRTPASVSNLSATRGKRRTAARRVTVTFVSSEAAAADVELTGTLKRGRQKGTLILSTGTLKTVAAGTSANLRLAIPASLAKLVGRRLSAQLTLTDLAGNRTQKTIAVTVTKTPKKKKAKN